jgi:hypothetical protein
MIERAVGKVTANKHVCHLTDGLIGSRVCCDAVPDAVGIERVTRAVRPDRVIRSSWVRPVLSALAYPGLGRALNMRIMAAY